MKIDLEQIRELLAVVGQTDITELTIESGDQKITVKKQVCAANTVEVAQQPQPAQMSVQPAKAMVPHPELDRAPNTQAVKEDKVSSNGHLIPIASPMVGTFYRAPSPTAASFVDVGDHISIGQTVCIIEAMKLMNDLPAEVSGKVVKVCAENGSTVEYGQPLFMVDPNG